MSTRYSIFCKRFICFGLALILGLASLVIIVPLVRAKTIATPDPLAVSDRAYAGKSEQPQENPSNTKAAKEDRIDWNAWHTINPDLVGWLSIPSLKFSLPLVQARRDNPTYYLDHDIYGNENIYGCPYVDVDCAEEGLDSRHVIIMGHSLTDGSMFSPLLSYTDETFAQQHREVILYTPKKTTVYQVRRASIVSGDAKAKYSNFDSEDAFFNWLVQEDNRALYTLDNTPAHHGISLVTCSYFKDPTNERFVLFCTSQEKPEVPPTTTPALPQQQPSGLLKLPDTGPAIMKP